MLRVVFSLADKKMQVFVQDSAHIISAQDMSIIPISKAKEIAIQTGFEHKQDNGHFLLIKNQIIVPVLSIEKVDHAESSELDVDTLNDKTMTIQVLDKMSKQEADVPAFNQKWIRLEEVEENA